MVHMLCRRRCLRSASSSLTGTALADGVHGVRGVSLCTLRPMVLARGTGVRLSEGVACPFLMLLLMEPTNRYEVV